MPKRNIFILVAMVVGCMLAWMARDRAGHGRRFAEVMAAIDRHALDRVDSARLFSAAMNGVFSQFDEHSGFISGTEQDQLETLLDQEFGGVGMELAVAADGRRITVLSPIVDSPAWRAGIVAGDVIEEIDGAAVAGMTLDDVVARLRGLPGTTVAVRVASPAAPQLRTGTRDPAAEAMTARVVALVRERVVVESVTGDRRRADGSWDWWIEGEDGIALLRISTFGERTAEEIAEAVAEIEARGVPRGVVLDLRGNAGGLLPAAVDVCDLFLDEGLIVSTRGGSGGGGERVASAGHVLDGVPLVVLIDGLTASAAEIVAACLQDSGRGIVVGSRSFGKGTVQTLLTLSDGSGIVKLTTAEYLRPSAATIHRRREDDDRASWGVSPDVAFQVTPTGQQLEHMRAWRQARDIVPAADGRASRPPGGALPREIDIVLARGLEALASTPRPPSGRGLGGQEETPGDAHDPVASGK